MDILSNEVIYKEKEVIYTEKEVDFLMNLYMKYVTEKEENYYFPIQQMIQDIVKFENNYFKIKKRYIKRHTNNKYKLKLCCFK